MAEPPVLASSRPAFRMASLSSAPAVQINVTSMRPVAGFGAISAGSCPSLLSALITQNVVPPAWSILIKLGFSRCCQYSAALLLPRTRWEVPFKTAGSGA